MYYILVLLYVYRCKSPVVYIFKGRLGVVDMALSIKQSLEVTKSKILNCA